jgi:hypothetical protein
LRDFYRTAAEKYLAQSWRVPGGISALAGRTQSRKRIPDTK